MSIATEKSSARGIRQSAERVNAALHKVVNQIPIPSRTPKDLARRLKIHRTLASRLLGALRMSDPLAVVTNIPGKQGLETILRAAESIVGSESAGEARLALDEFENIVEHGLGGREVLDVAMGAWLPEMREKQELACKQQVYRGLCGLAGASADVTVDMAIRYPSDDGERANLVMVQGLIGLRRLSPGKDIQIGTLGMIPGVTTPSGAVIQNLPGSSEPDGPPIIEEFSSSPLPPIREIRLGNYRQYLLSGEEIGNRSKVDIFTGVVVRNIAPLYRPKSSPPRRTGAAQMIEVPTKTLLMDFFVQEQALPLNSWQLMVHRTGQRGGVDPNDPIREMDRLECTDSIQYLGRGPERFGALEVARYPAIVRYVCDKLDLDSSQLIGHRCRVQYPLPHVQYSMGFELPTRDEGSGG
jgi:hypothetical protein